MGWSDPLGYYKFNGFDGFPLAEDESGLSSWQTRDLIVQIYLCIYEKLLAQGKTNDLPLIYTIAGPTGGFVYSGEDLNYLFGVSVAGVELPYFSTDADRQAWLESTYPHVSDYSSFAVPRPPWVVAETVVISPANIEVGDTFKITSGSTTISFTATEVISSTLATALSAGASISSLSLSSGLDSDMPLGCLLAINSSQIVRINADAHSGDTLVSVGSFIASENFPIGTSVSGSNVANVTAGLASAWNASGSSDCTPMTATNGTSALTLQLDTPGHEIKIATSTTNGGLDAGQSLLAIANVTPQVAECQQAWRGGRTGGNYAWVPVVNGAGAYDFYEDTSSDIEDHGSHQQWKDVNEIQCLRGAQEWLLANCINFVIYPDFGTYDGFTGTPWPWAGDSETMHYDIPKFNFFKLAQNAGITIKSGASPGSTSKDDYFYRRYYKQFKHLYGNAGIYTIPGDDSPSNYNNPPSSAYVDGSAFVVGDLAIHSGDNYYDEDAEGFVGYEYEGTWIVVAPRGGDGRVYKRVKTDDILWGATNSVSDYAWSAPSTCTIYPADLKITNAPKSVVSSESYAFTSADVGLHLYDLWGNNITGGDYVIASVSGGKASLDANAAGTITTSLTSALSNGMAYTSINVAAISSSASNGATVMIGDQMLVLSSDVSAGATSLPIHSFIPVEDYSIGASVSLAADGISGNAYLSGWLLQPLNTRPNVKEGVGFMRRDDIITARAINEIIACSKLLVCTEVGMDYFDDEPDVKNKGLLVFDTSGSSESTANNSNDVYSLSYTDASWANTINGAEYGTDADVHFTTSTDTSSIPGYEGSYEYVNYNGGVYNASNPYDPDSGWQTWAAYGPSASTMKPQAGTYNGIESPMDSRFDPHTLVCKASFMIYCSAPGPDDPISPLGPQLAPYQYVVTEDDADLYASSYYFVSTASHIQYRRWKIVESITSDDKLKQGNTWIGGLPSLVGWPPSDPTIPSHGAAGANGYTDITGEFGWVIKQKTTLCWWNVAGGMQFV